MKRINKVPKQWNDEDLIAWANDEAVAGRGVTDTQVAASVAARLKLESEDVEDVKEAVRAKFDAGAKQPQTTASPSVSEPAPKAEPQPSVPPFSQLTEDQKSTTLLIVEGNLNKYVETMKPGAAHQGNQGPSSQVMLYRTFQTILRQDGSDFNFMFGEMLKFVHKYRKSVFNERYVFRYFDRLPLTNSERRNLERFLNLVMTVCDPATRNHSVKQVDIDATMEGFKDPDAHQRVVAYFQV